MNKRTFTQWTVGLSSLAILASLSSIIHATESVNMETVTAATTPATTTAVPTTAPTLVPTASPTAIPIQTPTETPSPKPAPIVQATPTPVVEVAAPVTQTRQMRSQAS